MAKSIQAEHKAFEFLPGALIEIDLATRSITYMSRIAHAVFGYSSTDLDSGIPAIDIFSNPAEYERAMELVKSFGMESYQEHIPYTPVNNQDLYDFMLKKKDGSLFYGECQGAFVLDEDKIPISIRIYVRDLTEQRKMEASIADHEEKYRLLIENSIDCIWTLDKNLVFTFLSPTLENILGFKPEEWIGTSLVSHFRPQEREVIGPIAEEAIKNYKSFEPVSIETVILSKDKKEVALEIRSKVLLSSEGELLGLQGTTRDITTRKEAENALIESENKYHNIFNNSQDAVYITTESGSLIDFNQALVDMLGYSSEELMNMSISELYQNDEDRILFQQAIQAHGFVKDFELHIPKKDGTIIDCLDTSTMNKRPDGVIEYHGIIRDITEQKKSKKRIEQALMDVKVASAAKDQFIANMSHEFRTPLTSIIGFTDYLKKSLGNSLKPSDRESFDSIHRNSDRLLQTVNAILNFSQIQSGGHQLNPRIIYLNPFVQKLCNDFKSSAYKKGLEFDFISETDDDKSWLDEYSIRQAVENIVQNAIKYTNEGKITVKLTRAKNRLKLIISDTGIGISADFYKQIFQPFSQESEGLEREYQGLGLGLALTKRYLEWNNVDIDVDSRSNMGSSFTLTFPDSP
ncbi:MAG: PAS domain-containing sensor histidine kinase [Candidatus Marinimicrobia bacterium]|nr:PAS domain-containing sensor histidine kinase [Candidatus Neomarinimicrobiota bacterium]